MKICLPHTREPLQQKPVPPTSKFSNPFSELTYASASLGGRMKIKTVTQNYEHSQNDRIELIFLINLLIQDTN